jgi:hypothetical protein
MAVQPPVFTPRYKTFAELFADPEKDPCRGNYRQFMLVRFSGASNLAAARLMDQCVGSAGTIPQAFLCTRNFRIYCVHNLSKYQPAFDGSVTLWDDGIFGFMGDIISHHCTSVRLPPDVLTAIRIQAYTSEYMRANLDNLDAATGIFGIPPQGHAESSTITVRGIMVLPARYAPLLLNSRGYTPREVWELLLPLLEDDNLVEDCQPLVDWLRAATTASGIDPQTNRLLPATFNLNFSGPPADEDLLLHHSRIMRCCISFYRWTYNVCEI